MRPGIPDRSLVVRVSGDVHFSAGRDLSATRNWTELLNHRPDCVDYTQGSDGNALQAQKQRVDEP